MDKKINAILKLIANLKKSKGNCSINMYCNWIEREINSLPPCSEKDALDMVFINTMNEVRP